MSVNTYLVQVLHKGSQKAASKRLNVDNAGVLIVVLCSFLAHGVVEAKFTVYLHSTCWMMQSSETLFRGGRKAGTYDGIKLHVGVWQSNDVFLRLHILIHRGLRAGRSKSCPPLNRL